MPFRVLMIVLLGGIAGCTAAPNAQPLAVRPLNSEPWVATQSPPGTQDSSPQLPFQTPNSLPRGAVTTPGR